MKNQKKMLAWAEEYLAYRRKLGFKLAVEGGQVKNFARYADSTGHEGPLTTDLALDWATLPKSCSRLYHARRLEVVRGFAKYLVVFESRTQVPGNRLLGPAHRRTQPHIYSPEEIDRLLQTARMLAPIDGLRPRTYATLIGLIASTGLRTKEALSLSLKDVNLHEGVITIRETKFNKTRLVPLDKTVVHALREYADFREAYILIPQSANFFLGENGRRLGSNAIHWTFRRLCTACTLHSIPRGRNPRLYDLRHTFCTRRLLLWHQQGIDVEYSLLALSTYVGHVKVTDTYWYFSGVPELFAWIGAKFETYANKFKGDGL